MPGNCPGDLFTFVNFVHFMVPILFSESNGVQTANLFKILNDLQVYTPLHV